MNCLIEIQDKGTLDVDLMDCLIKIQGNGTEMSLVFCLRDGWTLLLAVDPCTASGSSSGGRRGPGNPLVGDLASDTISAFYNQAGA